MPTLAWSGEKLSPVLTERLHSSIQLWKGTRYHEGAQRPGAGVDCWRFVSAVADDMRQRPRVKLPRMISDVAMHNAVRARAALRWAIEEHGLIDIGGYLVTPGDCVIAGPPDGGPGHAMLAGPDGFLWHVTKAQGVDCTGLTTHGLTFYTILRVKPELWPQYPP